MVGSEDDQSKHSRAKSGHVDGCDMLSTSAFSSTVVRKSALAIRATGQVKSSKRHGRDLKLKIKTGLNGARYLVNQN